jgi:hypothetical protein
LKAAHLNEEKPGRLVGRGFTGAEKLSSFVGRAFRHDIKSAFSSGVLTPDGLKAHFSATCLAATPSIGNLPPKLFVPLNA